ncbi:MAG: hypothetical protein AAGM22_06235 [Acidobacteriota bacterium]
MFSFRPRSTALAVAARLTRFAAVAVVGCLLLSAFGFLSTPAHAQSLTWIANLGGFSGWGALEHGNGDKVAIGRFNTLHVVWEDGGLIKYSTSNDGLGWSAPELVAPGIPAAMPAIASDSNGTLVVAFVANPDANGMGTIRYARKAWGATSWSNGEIVTVGTQPDIDARAGRVHVVWTTIDRVQYTTFPTTAPPAPMTFGEEIEVSACPNTGFTRPSVALPRESCDLAPKVAYLRYSDETANPDPACAAIITEVGPRVCARDGDTGTWGLEYTDLVTATAPALGIDAISLSMNAHYSTGNVFLAWSDRSDADARTRLAHGRNGTWDAITFDNEERHAHVTAKRSSTDGDFRFAWVAKDGFFPFVDWDASFRTGEWHSGATPTWTDTPTVITTTSGGATIGRPQATYWAKCSGGSYDTVEAVAEVEGVCATTRLMNHITEDQSCPPITAIGLDPCNKHYFAYASPGLAEMRVDTEELGPPSRVSQRSVEFLLRSEEGLASVVFEWDRGRLVEAGPTGFVLDDPEATVRLVADGVRATLEQLPPNLIYDQMKPRQECRDR